MCSETVEKGDITDVSTFLSQQLVCVYLCVRVQSLNSLRDSTVMILSLHRRWQVWLSASRPELKSRHSIHSLKQKTSCFM